MCCVFLFGVDYVIFGWDCDIFCYFFCCNVGCVGNIFVFVCCEFGGGDVEGNDFFGEVWSEFVDDYISCLKVIGCIGLGVREEVGFGMGMCKIGFGLSWVYEDNWDGD